MKCCREVLFFALSKNNLLLLRRDYLNLTKYKKTHTSKARYILGRYRVPNIIPTPFAIDYKYEFNMRSEVKSQ